MLTSQVYTDVPKRTVSQSASKALDLRLVTHIYLYLFSVGIFYRRIVAFYPHVLHELSRQTALPNSTYP